MHFDINANQANYESKTKQQRSLRGSPSSGQGSIFVQLRWAQLSCQLQWPHPLSPQRERHSRNSEAWKNQCYCTAHRWWHSGKATSKVLGWLGNLSGPFFFRHSFYFYLRKAVSEAPAQPWRDDFSLKSKSDSYFPDWWILSHLIQLRGCDTECDSATSCAKYTVCL